MDSLSPIYMLLQHRPKRLRAFRESSHYNNLRWLVRSLHSSFSLSIHLLMRDVVLVP
jgi:hypothetical protein